MTTPLALNTHCAKHGLFDSCGGKCTGYKGSRTKPTQVRSRVGGIQFHIAGITPKDMGVR